MKRIICVIGAVLMLILSSACSSAELSEKDVREFYTEYVEAVKQDRLPAIFEYVHYEYESMLEADKEYPSDPLFHAEILRVEKLSPELWVLQIYYESSQIPAGATAYQFVGIIDGELKVMKGHFNVPSVLAQNLDLEQYAPDNYVHPDDVLPEGIEIE